MDENETNQMNLNGKVSSGLVLQDTEAEETLIENSIEPQVEVTSEVYAEQVGNENEVITIVNQETDGEVFIYDGNEEQADMESSAEYIQVCDSNSFEANNSEEKDVNVDGIEEEKNTKVDSEEGVIIEVEKENINSSKENEEEEGEEGVILKDGSKEMIIDLKDDSEEMRSKNFKNVILEDWEVETPHVVENHDSENVIVVEEKPEEEACHSNNENCKIEEMKEVETIEKTGEEPKENCSADENPVKKQNENVGGVISPVEKKIEGLKTPKSISKDQIVKILDDSSDRVVRPIVRGKDIFFSIELTKRLNQKLAQSKPKIQDGVGKHENDSCNNNNMVDDRQKIVDILEADEIKDWKSVPSKSDLSPKENGNDLEISKAIKSMQEIDSNTKKKTTPRRTPAKRYRMMDRELERTIALQQLREEFPSTRRRSRNTRKVNHIPFLASTVLEKALNSPEVTTALKPEPLRRRPCYLPENTLKSGGSLKKEIDSSPEKSPSDFELGKSISTPVVKTYSVKRKSTDAESDIKTTLEAVAKALNESAVDSESKPKKQKTVTKENKVLIKKKRKVKPKPKPGPGPEKKMNAELAKLLGDEGAVRMLYETQHGTTATSPKKRTKFKTTTGLKKDLVLKTKLVKNAVMRLSGVATDGVFLRGKRRLQTPTSEPTKPEAEPLFSSTPNIVFYKPKKKQRAEASRILYRHSSSESFESLDGQRRTSVSEESVGVSGVKTDEPGSVNADAQRTPRKGRIKKSETGQKKTTQAKEDQKGAERLSLDSQSLSGSGLDLSIVPVRKSSRPRVASKKYSIWSSTSMDCLSVESLGLKKMKKASTDLGKKLNCKEMIILDYEHLVQIVLTPVTTVLKNSLNYDVLQELIHVLNYLSKEENCRVILISSKGSTFCQGIDLNRIISFNESEKKKGISQLIKAIREFVILLANFQKPIIAGVQGAAVGLGVTLLPYCDLIISSDTASFQTPYVKLGQAPEGAATYTFPRINKQLVSELLFKSVKMTAADALKYGLVSQVIPEERFEKDLLMVARNMAAQPAEGLESIKSLLKRNDPEEIGKTLETEGQMLEEQWNSTGCLNNMIRFLNSGELQIRQFTNA